MNRKGSVLAQVLIMAVVGGLIAAELLASRMQPAVMAAQRVQTVSDDLTGQAALSKVNEVWARQGSCGTDVLEGVVCSGTGCTCSCDLATATVASSPGTGSSCLMTATAK